jgi:hypothetical protein
VEVRVGGAKIHRCQDLIWKLEQDLQVKPKVVSVEIACLSASLS